MGWDSPRAKGIIDNYPIGSLVDAGQSLGRITRIYIDEKGNEVVGLAVTVWDETAPRDFITYAQVLGETINDPDKILGATQEDGAAIPQPRDPAEGEQRRGLHMASLPDDLRGLVNEFSGVSLQDVSQKFLSEYGSLNAPEIFDERANRMITLDRASAILKLGRAEFIELAKKHGLGLKQSRKTQVFYVRQGDLATIVTNEELQFQQLPNGGYISVAEAAKALGRTLKGMEDFMQKRQKAAITFVDKANVPDRYISAEAFDSLNRSNAHQQRRERYRAEDREF